jgi:hypothetical protein
MASVGALKFTLMEMVLQPMVIIFLSFWKCIRDLLFLQMVNKLKILLGQMEVNLLLMVVLDRVTMFLTLQ